MVLGKHCRATSLEHRLSVKWGLELLSEGTWFPSMICSDFGQSLQMSVNLSFSFVKRDKGTVGCLPGGGKDERR